MSKSQKTSGLGDFQSSFHPRGQKILCSNMIKTWSYTELGICEPNPFQQTQSKNKYVYTWVSRRKTIWYPPKSFYFLVPKPQKSTLSFHIRFLSCPWEMQQWRGETTEITDRSDMEKIDLVQFSQTFKVEQATSVMMGFMTGSRRASDGNAGVFWHFSEWVGGEGKWVFFPSPFTYKKMEAMKSKVSSNVPLRETNEMQFPCSQKIQAFNQVLGRLSLLPLQELGRYSATHLVLLLPWRLSPFCIPWLGSWDWFTAHLSFHISPWLLKKKRKEEGKDSKSACLLPGHLLLSLCGLALLGERALTQVMEWKWLWQSPKGLGPNPSS